MVNILNTGKIISNLIPTSLAFIYFFFNFQIVFSTEGGKGGVGGCNTAVYVSHGMDS